nr:hypothetical protein [Tanacetum cinerariifolium]
LLEFADDTVINYSRPSPAIESTSGDVQNRNTSDTKTKASPSTISPKPFIKFVKAADRPKENKTDKGLAQVEERLAELRNRDLKYCKTIRVLEFKVEARADCIESLTKELEHIKKEK